MYILPSLHQTSQSETKHYGWQNQSRPWETLGVVQVHLDTWPSGHLASVLTADTWWQSPERTLHYKHRLDYVVHNRQTVSNHCGTALNEEYSPYVWTGGSGRLTHAHTHTHTHTHSEICPPGDWYTGLTGEHGGIKRSKGGSEKEREMSFKWHPHCEPEQDDGTLQNC